MLAMYVCVKKFVAEPCSREGSADVLPGCSQRDLLCSPTLSNSENTSFICWLSKIHCKIFDCQGPLQTFLSSIVSQYISTLFFPDQYPVILIPHIKSIPDDDDML